MEFPCMCIMMGDMESRLTIELEHTKNTVGGGAPAGSLVDRKLQHILGALDRLGRGEGSKAAAKGAEAMKVAIREAGGGAGAAPSTPPGRGAGGGKGGKPAGSCNSTAR